MLVSAFSYICNCSLGVRVVYCVTWAEAGGWAGRPVSGAPPPPTRAPSTRAPGRAPQLVNHGQLVSTTKSTDVNRVQVTGKVQVRSGHGWLKPVSRAAKTFSFKEGQFSIAIYNLAYQFLPPKAKSTCHLVDAIYTSTGWEKQIFQKLENSSLGEECTGAYACNGVSPGKCGRWTGVHCRPSQIDATLKASHWLVGFSEGCRRRGGCPVGLQVTDPVPLSWEGWWTTRISLGASTNQSSKYDHLTSLLDMRNPGWEFWLRNPGWEFSFEKPRLSADEKNKEILKLLPLLSPFSKVTNIDMSRSPRTY